MEAKDLFRKLGFKKIAQNDSYLVYLYEDDYTKLSVHFELPFEMYCVNYEIFIDGFVDFVPMKDRPENAKHSCRYGHWQREDFLINTKLHNAIHQQLIELGWIK